MAAESASGPQPRRVAVYWQLEDLAVGEYTSCHGLNQWDNDRIGGTFQPRDHNDKVEAARINISAVLDFAQTIGQIVINRFYADWTRQVFRNYRSQATEKAPVEFVQVYRDMLPAGLRISADVIVDLERNSQITDVLVCCGTRGFYGLATACGELGRQLHVIGTTGAHNAAWLRGCNYTYYSDVAGPRAEAPLPPWAGLVVAPFDDDPEKHLEPRALRRAMRAIDNSFDEKDYGFRVFWDFLRAAASRELVVLEDRGVDNRWVRRGPKQIAR